MQALHCHIEAQIIPPVSLLETVPDFNAEYNTGNPIFHLDNDSFCQKKIKVLSIFLAVVDKMAITAL